VAALKSLLAWALAAGLAAPGALAATPSKPPGPTAAEIVAKNAAARGGAEAWQKLQTMVWAGHAEGAKTPGHRLPFMIELKRPSSTRFEIASESGKSIRVYDGSHGWKLHPTGSVPDLQPYSAEELAFARDAQVVDGPLMHYSTAGAAITLSGVEQVEGRKAYVLSARLPSGDSGRVWVDAETFLELRADRQVRNAAGHSATVTVNYRDYHTFEGLQLPVVIETSAASGKAADRLVIEKVALNPPLDDQLFTKPNIAVPRHHGVIVDARGAPPAPRPVPPPPPQPPPPRQ
jgi:outer membrane lipoprotein-sorting protein